MSKNEVSVSANDEWRAREDMRTLIDARRIIKDRKRYAAARAMAQKQAKEMQEAAQLLGK